jgi:hypothetical protein
MFAGDTGELGIDKSGRIKNARNFVVRSSGLWRQRGYGVVLADAINHQSLRGQRSSAAYADVTREIVSFAREIAHVPVWLLGTSQGSIAAMNAASHARRTLVSGLILTESVSVPGGSHETVFDPHPDNVRIPALVVANRDDQCKVAPPFMAGDPVVLKVVPTTTQGECVVGDTMTVPGKNACFSGAQDVHEATGRDVTKKWLETDAFRLRNPVCIVAVEVQGRADVYLRF